MATGLDESLRAQLIAHAAIPIAQARVLPPAAYTDPAVLQLERERILASEWLCVGRTMEVPANGDYVTQRSRRPMTTVCCR